MFSRHRIAIALGLVLLSLGFARAQEPESEGRVFVLVVGVEDYADPKITDLTHAEDDAQAVYDFFAKNPRSPTVAGRVRLLRGKAATQRAIRLAIRDHLIRKATGPKDTAIFYFAGHGFADAYGVYLGTVDTKLTELELSGLAWSDLQRDWSRIAAGRRVFIADACHSGGLKGLRGPGGIGKRTLALKSKVGSASVTVAATGANQLSTEDARSGHGVFTASLLAGLAGKADANRDGAVTLGELDKHLRLDVPQRAKAVGGNQTPELTYTGDEAYGRGLSLSVGRARAIDTRGAQLARVQAERRAAERERERAELRARLAEAQLKKLAGSSGADRERIERELVAARASALRAKKVSERLEAEERKRIAAEERALAAEAESAELRRKLAQLEGKQAEADQAGKEAAAARKRLADLGGSTPATTPGLSAEGIRIRFAPYRVGETHEERGSLVLSMAFDPGGKGNVAQSISREYQRATTIVELEKGEPKVLKTHYTRLRHLMEMTNAKPREDGRQVAGETFFTKLKSKDRLRHTNIYDERVRNGFAEEELDGATRPLLVTWTPLAKSLTELRLARGGAVEVDGAYLLSLLQLPGDRGLRTRVDEFVYRGTRTRSGAKVAVFRTRLTTVPEKGKDFPVTISLSGQIEAFVASGRFAGLDLSGTLVIKSGKDNSVPPGTGTIRIQRSVKLTQSD